MEQPEREVAKFAKEIEIIAFICVEGCNLLSNMFTSLGTANLAQSPVPKR